MAQRNPTGSEEFTGAEGAIKKFLQDYNRPEYLTSRDPIGDMDVDEILRARREQDPLSVRMNRRLLAQKKYYDLHKPPPIPLRISKAPKQPERQPQLHFKTNKPLPPLPTNQQPFRANFEPATVPPPVPPPTRGLNGEPIYENPQEAINAFRREQEASRKATDSGVEKPSSHISSTKKLNNNDDVYVSKVSKTRKKMPLWMKVVVGILLTIITAIVIYAFYTLIKLLIGITTKDDISTTNNIARWLPIWDEEGNYPNYCVTPKAYVDIILHCHGMNMLPIFKEQVDSMRDAYMTSNDWPTIEDATFNSLPNLITLNLSNSNIDHIEDGAFQNLAKLEHLYLAGNRITALKSTIFNQLSSLIELDLRGNPAEICKSATQFTRSIKVHLPESCINVPSFTTPGPDICNGVSCSDHGICETVDDMPTCYCDTGYTGAFCEEKVDPCMSQPCKNGFACTSTDGSYNCICDNDDCKPQQRKPPKKLITMIVAMVVAVLVVFVVAYIVCENIKKKKINGTIHH